MIGQFSSAVVGIYSRHLGCIVRSIRRNDTTGWTRTVYLQCLRVILQLTQLWHRRVDNMRDSGVCVNSVHGRFDKKCYFRDGPNLIYMSTHLLGKYTSARRRNSCSKLVAPNSTRWHRCTRHTDAARPEAPSNTRPSRGLGLQPYGGRRKRNYLI